MKKHMMFYPFILMGLFFMFTSSCKKDDINNNSIFTDIRDGNVYKIVKIGNQIWMAENLKYLPIVADPATGSKTTPYYYVYGYNGTNVTDAKSTANYITYGVLYNWTAACNSCPAGWHLPSNDEWTQLTEYLEDESNAGGKLKETGRDHWSWPNSGATNETGFTALPGGCLDSDGTFYGIGRYGSWWSVTEDNADNAWDWYLACSGSYVYNFNGPKELGYSVRCIKD